MAFMPHEVIDQRVIAVYFDKDRRVEKLANYGLKDGKVFDFVTQTTKTGGQELNYLRNILKTFSPKMIMD
jgi:outer membrane protein assembly factor BamE (lipoprotein component of BamABCDE complex)